MGRKQLLETPKSFGENLTYKEPCCSQSEGDKARSISLSLLEKDPARSISLSLLDKGPSISHG